MQRLMLLLKPAWMRLNTKKLDKQIRLRPNMYDFMIDIALIQTEYFTV